jgi:hypothetical protein
MSRLLSSIAKVLLGIALGEAVFFLGVLDRHRATAMAAATGVETLRWISLWTVVEPVSFPAIAVSMPLCERAGNYIPLAIGIGLYWGIIGVISLHLALMLVRARRKRADDSLVE